MKTALKIVILCGPTEVTSNTYLRGAGVGRSRMAWWRRVGVAGWFNCPPLFAEHCGWPKEFGAVPPQRHDSAFVRSEEETHPTLHGFHATTEGLSHASLTVSAVLSSLLLSIVLPVPTYVIVAPWTLLLTAHAQVDALLLQFVPRIEPLIDAPYPVVEQIVKAVFSKRRKFIRTPLKWVIT